MKTLVITGSSRGIGFGLANECLARGCSVVISSRSQQAVDEAVNRLLVSYEESRILGQPCDVTDLQQVEALWEAAITRFGAVDIWVNNAGIGHPLTPVWELPPEKVKAILDTNLLGAYHGARAAIRGMIVQGHGHVYNLEGFGADMRIRKGLSIYGLTKAGNQYLSKALAKEVEDTPVKVSSIRPGMVITNLVTDQYKDDPEGFESFKKILNIIADTTEMVSPWMADKILTNEKNGAAFKYLSTPKLILRFITAPLTKRNLFDE